MLRSSCTISGCFWKHKWMVLLTTVLGIAAGLGYSLSKTPLYYARTSVEIQNFHEPVIPTGPADTDLGTKVQLLTSGVLANRVRTKLIETPAPFPKVDDPLSPLRHFLGLKDPATTIEWDTAVSQAAGERRVSVGKDSQILLIESKSPNPQAAADFTNTLAEEYIAQSKEERWASYENTGDYLTRAQAELKARLRRLPERLHAFAKNHGLIVTGSEDTAEDRLKQLQSELGNAIVDRIGKQAKYEASTDSKGSESLPDILDSGPMASYQAKIAELNTELARLSTTLTPENPKVQQIQAQLKEVEAREGQGTHKHS